MRIGNREIGINHRPYIIAEIGVNHDGDVERALELTDAAADANADAIKLQFFETDRLMSKAAKLAAYQKNAGETDPIEMLRRLELTIDEMARVVERAHSKNIHAIVTVFSTELVEVAETLPWDAYKTASPDIVNKPLLEALMQTGKPMIVSTGASTMDEVVQAVNWLEPARDRLAVLQCVSSYPAPESAVGGVRALRIQFDLPVGYSDHTRENAQGFWAVIAGASVIEKHFTDDCKRAGPDHAASLHWSQLKNYCENARSGVIERDGYELVIQSPYSADGTETVEDYGDLPDHLFDKLNCEDHGAHGASLAIETPTEKRVLDCEQDVRTVSRQSVVSAQDIPANTTITRDMLTIKRPGTGILACNLESVIGCTTSQSIESDIPIQETDLVQFEPLLASV
ncbi:legI [Symbiodinium sp. CCMP2592]|nr:legI [Symbiodinium sp. CCMP2592]